MSHHGEAPKGAAEAPLGPMDWPSDFERGLLDSALEEAPSRDLESRTIGEIAYRRRLLALATPRIQRPARLTAVRATALGLALASAAMLLLRQFELNPRTAGPPIQSVQEPAPTVERTSTTPPTPLVDPCARRARALGREPLIDDFESGTDMIEPRDGRAGSWRWVRDTDSEGAAPALLPLPTPEPRPGNKLAAHVKGGVLSDWGASVELTFQPSCYDASVYGGIAFSARGPGRLYVALREVRVIPVELHGSCTSDCFNAHVRKIDLEPRFKDYEIRWADVEQRGRPKVPLDATALHDISFQIHPEDTPYDIWIDTVRFIERSDAPAPPR